MSFKKRILQINALLFVIFTLMGLFYPQQSDKEKEALLKWKKALEDNPVPEIAKKLQYKFSYPDEKSEENGIYLIQGSNLCIDKKDNIFVTDSRAHTILKFNITGNFIQNIGQKGQGPGELINPRNIFCDDRDHIFVLDDGNRSIKTFDKEGKFINGFKYFKSYFSMEIDEKDKIYANYVSVNPEDPLIDVIDLKGTVTHSFGNRIKINSNDKSNNEVFLSLNANGDIYVVWKNLDFVRKYSQEEELLVDLKISYKPIKEIANKNLKAKKDKQNRLTFYNLIMGMRAKENGFYLFRSYPRIEILEFNDNGEIENIYWHDTQFQYIPGDFIVIENNNGLEFHILQQHPESQIDVFEAEIN